MGPCALTFLIKISFRKSPGHAAFNTIASNLNINSKHNFQLKEIPLFRSTFFAAITLAIISAGILPATAAVANVTITAKDFSFSPSVVHLKKGQTVHFHLRASQGVHGLNVPAVGIDNATLTSKVTNITAVPKKAGTFVAHCAVFCGAGHQNMKMTFIVH